MGVLFRKGDALQQLSTVDVVALDKTGTVTEGRPELTDLVLADGFDRAEVLALIAAVEAQSEHPIAEAILRAAEAEREGERTYTKRVGWCDRSSAAERRAQRTTGFRPLVPSSVSLVYAAVKSLTKRALSLAYAVTYGRNFLSWMRTRSEGSIISLP